MIFFVGEEGAEGGFLLEVEGLEALGSAVAESCGGDAGNVGDCGARGCEGIEV